MTMTACAAIMAALAAGLSACSSGTIGETARAMIVPIAVEPPAVPLSQAKFAFAPVTGAPATVLINISAALGREAYAQQMTLVPVDDPAVTYTVKGYLSAVGDASGTIVVYVWDVLDRSGRRVHRVSGQQQAAGAQRDPWSSVDNATASDIARQTIEAMVAWGKSGPVGAPQPLASAPVSALPVTTIQPPAVTTPVSPSVGTIPTLPPLPRSAGSS